MADQVFESKLPLPVSAEAAFAWHERSGSLARLMPPWERVRISRPATGVDNGTRVEFKVAIGPFWGTMLAEHFGYEAGVQFCDRQLKGPFRRWEHTHRFETLADGPRLLDHIEYRLPGGRLGSLLGGKIVRSRLRRMFEFRRATTRDDLAAHDRFSDRPPGRIAVTGSSGLVGSALVPFLSTGGHQVIRLVRETPDEGDIGWDPREGRLNPADLEGLDAVVHLAGKGIATRWNDRAKKAIRESRVNGTRLLSETLARLERPPAVLISASAIGLYGDRADEELHESSAAGDGFLAEVASEWEASTQAASEAGIRVVHVRFGMILSPLGGALPKLLTPTRLGAGSAMGSGRQYWSWISLDDAVGAIHHAMMSPGVDGAVNLVAPQSTTCRDFVRTLGRILRRPVLFRVPRFLLCLGLGEMADALLLASARVRPGKLIDSGYHYRHPTLEEALRHLLGRT